MKKSAIAMILAGAACAGLYWNRHGQASLEAPPSVAEHTSTTKREIAAALARAASVPTPQSSATLTPQQEEPTAQRVDEGGSVPVKLTAAEQALVVMYDAMAKAIDTNAADCAAMASSLGGLTKKHADEVTRWSAEQEHLDPTARRESEVRVQAAAGPTTERFRQSLRRGLSTCAADASLLAAVGQLGALAAVRTP